LKLLTESQLFPPVDVFALGLQSGEWWIEVCENYNKGSYRNKYRIMGANGPVLLSVPLVKGKNRAMPIEDVLISYDENWQLQHIRTLKSAYGKSPFFEEYFSTIREFLDKKFKYLLDLNQEALQLMIQFAGVPIQIHQTVNYTFKDDLHTSDLLDKRDFYKAKKVQPDSHFIKYPQLFEDKHGFIPGLSILDLLFCTGPECIVYLKKEITRPNDIPFSKE